MMRSTSVFLAVLTVIAFHTLLSSARPRNRLPLTKQAGETKKWTIRGKGVVKNAAVSFYYFLSISHIKVLLCQLFHAN